MGSTDLEMLGENNILLYVYDLGIVNFFQPNFWLPNLPLPSYGTATNNIVPNHKSANNQQ